jgi:hypothetical protein
MFILHFGVEDHVHGSHDHLCGGPLSSALAPTRTPKQPSLRIPANRHRGGATIPFQPRTSALVRGSTLDLNHGSVTEDGCDLFADYPLMLRMITIALEICLSGEDSDDCEVVTL